MFEFRPYQNEAIETMMQTEIGSPTLIVLPCGTGKTVVFASVVSKIKGRVLIIVPQSELMEQSILKIKKIDPFLDVGRLQGQKFNNVSSRVMVGTWQSLSHKKSKRIKNMLEHGEIEYVIIDEVHLAVDKLQKILSQLENCKVSGLTATPWNPKLLKLFHKVAYSKNILEMIEKNYLCDPLCYQVQSETDLNQVGMSAGDFKENELQEAVNNIHRNKLIVKSYIEYAKDRKSTIIFASGIQHIADLVREFTEAGIYCKGLDSKNYDKEYRDDVIAEFKRGELPILINCGILTTGFDMEDLSCVILARPTRSKILYVQCLGRGLRPHPDKENCLVIDIVDILRSHDLCSVNDIFEMKIKNGETLKKAQKRVEDEIEKQRLEEEKKKEQEIERQRQKDEEIKLKAQQINLFNTDMARAFSESLYDWWKCDIVTHVLTYRSNTHYAIEKVNNKFFLFNIKTGKGDTDIKFVKESPAIDKLIDYVENDLLSLMFNHNLFTEINADFKLKPASDAQIDACKYSIVKTHWDVQKYFSGYNIKNLLKNEKMNQVM